MEWPPPCTSLPSSSGGCTIGTAASDLYYGDDDEGKTGSEVGCVRTIDRYDARTLLDDTYLVMLSKGCLHSFHISKKEAEIEQLCDNERYADLYEAMKHENDVWCALDINNKQHTK
ncbi:hypothetical protein Pelo_16419 [Pelomyxa schiedti]|nr:hypothetical protein Pelo_16419 [Pelomyxa schiedti]